MNNNGAEQTARMRVVCMQQSHVFAQQGRYKIIFSGFCVMCNVSGLHHSYVYLHCLQNSFRNTIRVSNGLDPD